MDFWTRLIGGGTSGPQKREAIPNNPQQRLARFKRVYSQLLQLWQKSPTLSSDAAALDAVRTSFQRMTAILHDESRSPAPHLSLSFAAASNIYTTVSRIAASSYNEAVVREAVAFFGALIDSEEEDFLVNERFAQALMSFVGRIVGSSGLAVGEDTEGEIVELLFGIAAKIRLQPEILPVWFVTRSRDDDDTASIQQKADFAGITQKEDFPLCYHMIDHVHHEGRIGDFARTGLLYIFESASNSPDLERWIVESDLATLMASGLGALYSQLSRKLSIVHPDSDLPLILTLSDDLVVKPSREVVSMFSPDFQVHFETFLSYLAFWQDVLEHCKSYDVRQTLLDHFQILFLQQLLYPSLLESSDVDGGSSVAVLTYLRRILDALDHPELVHMILHYLLAMQEAQTKKPQTPMSPILARRRSSLILMTEPADEDDRMNPSLFNLVDLVLSSVASTNPQTVISALKLVSVILSKNHNYAVGTLVKTVEIPTKEPQRTHGALNAEVAAYLALAEDMGGESGLDEAYEGHLKDVQSALESHQCSRQLLLRESAGSVPDYFSQSRPGPVQQHEILHQDLLLSRLADLLSTFLTNSVETNLALTEAFSTLGVCAQVKLESWLALDPVYYQFDDQQALEEQSEMLHRIFLARREPSWQSDRAPVLLRLITSLSEQLSALRTQIPDLEAHITSRKQAFRVHEEITEAMRATPQIRASRPQTETPSGSWTPQIPRHVLESSTPASSRSMSPSARGRAGQDSLRAATGSPAAKRSLGASPAPSSSRGRSVAAGDSGRSIDDALLADVVGNMALVTEAEGVKKKVRFTRFADGSTTVEYIQGKDKGGSRDQQKTASDDVQGPDGDKEMNEKAVASVKEVSLSHVLTNAVILQEFVLELVALLQVRASLFGEVKFA